MNDEDGQITIKIKQNSTNLNFDITISKLSSVLDLKKECALQSNIEESAQNLVYKGRLLSDDKMLQDYDIKNDHTIIIIFSLRFYGQDAFGMIL